MIMPTTDLTAGDLTELRRLMDLAFEGDFDDNDWDHALGGTHSILRLDGRIVAHASAVPRRLRAGDRSLAAAYVEAVAVLPELQGRGYGTQVMGAIMPVVDASELGALGTGAFGFYERLGWQRWLGTTWVLRPEGRVRTPDDDACVMVRRTPRTRHIDLRGELTCDDRPGDVW